jgi:hypothetical protein
MRIGSGAVDLAGLQFRARDGRQITADVGRFDGRRSLHFLEALRINGRLIEPPLDGVEYRIDTGELIGCNRKCG